MWRLQARSHSGSWDETGKNPFTFSESCYKIAFKQPPGGSYKSLMRRVGSGRSQRGTPRSGAESVPVTKLTEDQLGEAPIRPGDSVIIVNEVAVWIRIPCGTCGCKQGGTAYNTSLVFRNWKTGVF